MKSIFAAERQNIIVNLINEKGSITITDLIEKFNASKMTIWRDLTVLDERGLLKKVHGGAIKTDKPSSQEPTFEEKATVAAEEKELIAKYAAENLVTDNNIISLDAGSTAIKMIPFLKQKNLTLLTTGLNAMALAAKYGSKFTVIGCGGELRQPALAFVGSIAEQFFRDYKVDVTFLSATGISINDGITDPHLSDVRVKKAMMEGAEKVIFLMDSSKINKRSLAITTKIEDIDLLITDYKISDAFVEDLNRLGVKYEIVRKNI